MQNPASVSGFQQVLFKYKTEIYSGVYRLVAVKILEKQGRLYCLIECLSSNQYNNNNKINTTTTTT